MIRESWSHTLEQELARQRDAMRQLGFTDDYREGVPHSSKNGNRGSSADDHLPRASLHLCRDPEDGDACGAPALREHMGAQDMEQVGLFVQRKLPIPELAQIRHGHLTLQQIRRHLSAEDFDGAFKFAFVRNPFDRFVSYCAFITRAEGHFERDPKAVMRSTTCQPARAAHPVPAPKCFRDRSGREIALGRPRAGRGNAAILRSHRGADRIPSQPLEKVNASSRRDYREYYDAPLKSGVARLYARDLELFGYEF